MTVHSPGLEIYKSFLMVRCEHASVPIVSKMHITGRASFIAVFLHGMENHVYVYRNPLIKTY
jgi:hypothetical protein